METPAILEAVRTAIGIAEKVDEKWQGQTFERVLQHLLTAGGQMSQGVQQARRPPHGSANGQGLGSGEFLALLNPGNHLDAVEGILYHALARGEESLNAGDILGVYKATRRKPPANLSDILGKCIKRGHVVEASERKEGKKAWQITPSGERYIGESLEAE